MPDKKLRTLARRIIRVIRYLEGNTQTGYVSIRKNSFYSQNGRPMYYLQWHVFRETSLREFAKDKKSIALGPYDATAVAQLVGLLQSLGLELRDDWSWLGTNSVLRVGTWQMMR